MQPSKASPLRRRSLPMSALYAWTAACPYIGADSNGLSRRAPRPPHIHCRVAGAPAGLGRARPGRVGPGRATTTPFTLAFPRRKGVYLLYPHCSSFWGACLFFTGSVLDDADAAASLLIASLAERLAQVWLRSDEWVSRSTPPPECVWR